MPCTIIVVTANALHNDMYHVRQKIMHSYISLKQETESQAVACRDKLTVTPVTVINRIVDFSWCLPISISHRHNRPKKYNEILCTFDQTVFKH